MRQRKGGGQKKEKKSKPGLRMLGPTMGCGEQDHVETEWKRAKNPSKRGGTPGTGGGVKIIFKKNRKKLQTANRGGG